MKFEHLRPTVLGVLRAGGGFRGGFIPAIAVVNGLGVFRSGGDRIPFLYVLRLGFRFLSRSWRRAPGSERRLHRVDGDEFGSCLGQEFPNPSPQRFPAGGERGKHRVGVLAPENAVRSGARILDGVDSLADSTLPGLHGVEFSAQPFWANIIADRQLAPEIRDGHLTVYFRGGALLRSLQLEGNTLVANVHPKFIPVRAASSNVRLAWLPTGFGFTEEAHALPLGDASPDVLRAYKEEMGQVLTSFPEGALVQRIYEREENTILDQEIAFQEPGEKRDTVDLCHYDAIHGKLAMIEVKRRDDSRLLGQSGRPEVLDQLAAYGRRIVANRERVIEAYRTVTSLKRRLGIENRIQSVPEEGPSDLFAKPILVIGNCSMADVRAIRSGMDEWAPLMDGLPEVAAGLILCGGDGCRLDLVPGRQTLVFSGSPRG